MHHLSVTDAKTVELTSLGNGDVFICNTPDGHGHQTGLVFSERGVLFLSGPDRFVAIQRAFLRTPVVGCPGWTNLALRVPELSGIGTWQSAKAGRIVLDERGAHLVFRWQDEEGRPGGFSALSLATWTHAGVPPGIALDTWSLVRVDDAGRDVVLVEGPG